MSMQTSPTFSWNKDDRTTLTQMADGFDEYRPPLSRALAGRLIELDCGVVGVEDSAHTFTHEFGDGELSWSVSTAGEIQSGRAEYQLFEMQPGLFFLHYRRIEAEHPVVVTLALDLTTGQASGAIGELGLGPEPHLARQAWFQGQVVGSDATAAGAHPRTNELIGRRVRYAYSSDDVYDHIYLNHQLFTWFCVKGAEAGLGDTDRCVHWKLREETYLFSWLEKNVGVEGMVLIDLEALRTVGIQFGLDQQSGDLVNITMGAYAMPLGDAPDVEDALPGPAGN